MKKITCQNRFNESVDEYSLNGSIKHLIRRGKKNDGEYGKIDNLHAYYDGNQLQKSGNFAADTLCVERTTDENGTFIIEKSERYE